MSEFAVIWTIEVNAASAEEAAKLALKIQRDPASIATVFVVKELPSGKQRVIDLLAEQVPEQTNKSEITS